MDRRLKGDNKLLSISVCILVKTENNIINVHKSGCLLVVVILADTEYQSDTSALKLQNLNNIFDSLM